MNRIVLITVLSFVLPVSTEQASARLDNPELIKLPTGFGPHRIENTPVIYQGRPLLVENSRLTNEVDSSHVIDMYIIDLTTNEVICRFGGTFAFNCAYVNGDELNVFATKCTETDWTASIYRFWTTDLKGWESKRVIANKKGEHFFNTSVCKGPNGYIMAYESNVPVQWCFRLARSQDLAEWEPIESLIFADKVEHSVLANPTIRYIEPYYYLMTGIHRHRGKADASYAYHRPDSRYFTFLLRSKDLATWDLSPTRYPMLEPDTEDGINATDADLFEFLGNTYIFYGAGWQDSRGTIRVKMYPGSMKECLESYFDDTIDMIQFNATEGRYIYPEPGARPQKILFLGDSISVGSSASDAQKRYSSVLTTMLNKTGANYKEVNLAIGGSTLVEGTWPRPGCSGYPHVLGRAIAAKPDVFVIQHGTNDNALCHSLTRFLWSYRETVRTIKQQLPDTKIVCMTICPSWDIPGSTDAWLNRTNAGIQEIAAMENTLLAQAYARLRYRRELFTDGIHPDDTGHKIMAESVAEAITNNRVMCVDDFELTFRTPGEYRVCGYRILARTSAATPASAWGELYHFGQKAFQYRSDYTLDIVTPFRYCHTAFKVYVTDDGGKTTTVSGTGNEWSGQAKFVLPPTNGQTATVKIELPKS